MFKETKKLITHDGKFHADDLFACAVICLLLKKRGESFEILRTRDPKLIESGDFVFDVGGVYDPAQNRFDHHQKGGAGERANGIPYAAIGLVWKTYGSVLCGNNQEIVDAIDQQLIQPIDANDNGIEISESVVPNIRPVFLQDVLYAFRATWKENAREYDKAFVELVPFVMQVIERYLITTRDYLEGVNKVREIYESTEDKRVIVLDGPYPCEEYLALQPEPLFVVAPRPENKTWKVNTVRVKPMTFVDRKKLPTNWAGLRDHDLETETGVPGALFCHNARFLVVAETKEAALSLAQKALLNNE